MPSEIDAMLGDAAAELNATFGESGRLLLRIGNSETAIDAAISGERLAVETDMQDNEIKTARRTAVVTRAALAAAEIHDLPLRTMATIDGREYALDPNATQWGTAAVTIGLERSIISRLSTMEKGGQGV